MLLSQGNPLEFGLCCVINSNSSSTGFADFIFVRELSGVPLVRCFNVNNPGPISQIRLRLHPKARSKQFGFSIVDQANNASVTLTSLKITHKSGSWIFGDPKPPLPSHPELTFSGSATGVSDDNTNIDPMNYLLFRFLESRLLSNLEPFKDDSSKVLKFSVEASMNTPSGPKTYFADPEIGVETGGDS